MGLFDRFGARGESRRAKAARARELAGDLGRAIELYLEADKPDEAARVLLLRADAEQSTEKRIAFCALAARTAVGDEMRRSALGRKARLAFDVLKAKGAAFMKSELLGVAAELEQAGELDRAADAYALAGDAEAEVRVLTAAGAIERLEERLRVSGDEARVDREQELALRKLADLDRTAERRAALELARNWLLLHDDERVADMVRVIRARLARGPLVDLEIEGVAARWALGDEVTIGRGDATIVVSARSISRRHVRLRRTEAGPVVEDLGTRNGTTLAGARLAAALPVGSGLELLLGGEIACSIRPLLGSPEGLAVEVGGGRFLVPLGEAIAGIWRIAWEREGDDTFVVLRTPPGAARPVLGGFELAQRVELCIGDSIRAVRGGPVLLRVLSGDGHGDGGPSGWSLLEEPRRR